jgi:hypothetical protein
MLYISPQYLCLDQPVTQDTLKKNLFPFKLHTVMQISQQSSAFNLIGVYITSVSMPRPTTDTRYTVIKDRFHFKLHTVKQISQSSAFHLTGVYFTSVPMLRGTSDTTLC